MAIIPYPTEARLTSVSLQPIVAAQSNRSELTNARQVVDVGYSWWAAEVSVSPMYDNQAREWKLFLGRLRGPTNSFRIPIANQHSETFTVRAQGAGSGYSLSTDGWPVSSTPLEAGEYVTVGNQLMMLDQDVVSNASGVAVLYFHSPLRGSVADNTVIETAEPFLLAALPDNAPALTLGLAQIQAGFSFEALEAY